MTDILKYVVLLVSALALLYCILHSLSQPSWYWSVWAVFVIDVLLYYFSVFTSKLWFSQCSLTVSQTLKGSSGLKGFQCHWGGVRLQLGGGPGRVRSRAWYGNTRYPICTAKSSGTKFVLWSLAVQNSSCEASGTKFVLRSVAELNLYCKVLRYTIGTARIQ